MPAHPYDVKFTVGASEYGFMLVTPPGESKSLNIVEVGGPQADRITTATEASMQEFDPRFDTPFAMPSFIDGAGQLEFGDKEFGYWWGSGIVTHVDGKAYLAPPLNGNLDLTSSTGNITGFTTYTASGGTQYDFCWSGPRLYRRDASNATNAWTLVYTASVDITDFKVFNGVGLIAVPTHATATIDFYTQADVTASATWTPTSRNHTAFSSGVKPKLWLPVRGTLFACVDNRSVFYTVDPTSDGWAGPIESTVESITAPQAGDNTYPFTGMTAVNDYVFVFKKTAGYSIDSEQNVTETFWQWKEKPSEHNFRFFDSGGDLLAYSVGPEVYVYDPASGSNLPLRLARRDGFSVREILGLAADNQYIYVLATVRVPTLRSANSVALLRVHRVGGSTWAPEVLWEDTDLTGNTYFRLAALPYGVGTRLYWGVVTSSQTTVMSMDVPADWDESTSGSFATSGTLYTSISRANFPGFEKRHLYLGASADNEDSDNTIAVAYSIDGGATFSSLGTIGASTPPFSYSDVHSNSIVLRFTFTSAAGTVTPVLRTFDHHQRVRFRYLQSVTAGLRIADKVERQNRTRDPNTKTQLRAYLELLRTSEERILYEDFLGNSFYCSVDSVGMRPTRHEDPTGDRYEMEALVVINRADRGG